MSSVSGKLSTQRTTDSRCLVLGQYQDILSIPGYLPFKNPWIQGNWCQSWDCLDTRGAHGSLDPRILSIPGYRGHSGSVLTPNTLDPWNLDYYVSLVTENITGLSQHQMSWIPRSLNTKYLGILRTIRDCPDTRCPVSLNP